MATLLDKNTIRKIAEDVPGAGPCVVAYDMLHDGIRVKLGDQRWVCLDHEVFLCDRVTWEPLLIREIRRRLEVA